MTKRSIGQSLILGIILLFLTFSVQGREATPLLRVTFIDVGQGDAILLRSADRTVLIDAGDDRYNAGSAAVVPYLRRHGIKKIDTLVISHPHRDHFGGILDVLGAVKIGEVLYSQDSSTGSEKAETTSNKAINSNVSFPSKMKTLDVLREISEMHSPNPLRANDLKSGSAEAILYQKMKTAIQAQEIPYIKARVGMALNWGTGIKTELLHHAETREPEESLKVNANEDSLIIKVTAGKISYLFTGDAENGAETDTVSAFGKKLQATVLKSGHHGSKTSSNAPFMEMVNPNYAVIQVGKGNSFGHPSQSTLDTYKYYKTRTFRNDRDGTVESWTDGKDVFFSSNQSPLAFTLSPKLISLTANSATFQWNTNKTSDSQITVRIGESIAAQKVSDQFVTLHTMTLTGLKPATAYRFKIVSVDEREKQQVIDFEGTFETPAGSGIPLPNLSDLKVDQKTIYVRRPFKTGVTVTNPGTAAQSGLIVNLYHSSIDCVNLLCSHKINSLAAGKNVKVEMPTEITWMGKVELILVLLQGKTIIDTASLLIDVLPKTILVDCAHGNIDYYTGIFAGMKMDLGQKRGYTLKSFSKPLNSTTVAGAFAIIIPTLRKEYAAEELAVLKSFIKKGGSLLMFSMSDYKNYSTPHISNEILKAIGSSIRFNDDQFCDPTTNTGPPWRPFITKFPSGIVKDIDKLLIQSGCSLINSDGEGLTAGQHRFLLATGDSDSYNTDADGLNDGYIYASHTPILPIPVAAAEDLGTGRVACIGEKWYEDKWFSPTVALKTPDFLRQVVDWLCAGRTKTLKSLLAYAQDIDNIDDPENRAIRADNIRGAIRNITRKMILKNPHQLQNLKSLLWEFQGPMIDSLNSEVDDMLRFESIYSED